MACNHVPANSPINRSSFNEVLTTDCQNANVVLLPATAVLSCTILIDY
jgi:ribosomal protein S27E